jgi:DNA repair exonuclease SbcCD ATPase subunit
MTARPSRLLPIALFVAQFCFAQTPAAPQAQSPAAQTQAEAAGGVAAPWDAQKLLADLNAHNQEMAPLLNEINPQAWMDQSGAPSAYLSQWNTAKQQLADSAASIQRLNAQSDNIYLCLDTYFRMEALETTERSLLEGTRTYGARPVADKLQELIARNYTAREQFRQYLLELTANREQMFQIADREAQRCRGMISKEAPATAKKKATSK